MVVADIERVLEIDTLAYPLPWKAKGYHYELTGNELAHYFVLETESKIIGFNGLWLIGGECHISTVAVHPKWQRLGLGELLFWHMQWQALGAEVELSTLEVRESNHAAQSLYRKYGMEVVGRRKRYYKRVNAGIKEDALLMTVTPLDNQYRIKMGILWESIIKHLLKLRPDTLPPV